MANYFYNNTAVLAKIPDDVLAEYPYCFIRQDTNRTYQLMCAKQSWYAVSQGANSIALYSHSYDGVTNDAIYYTYSDDTWGNPVKAPAYFGERTFIWTSHDIYYNANSAEVVYFRHIKPALEDISYIPSEKQYYYNGHCLPEIPPEVLEYYPYVYVRFSANNSCYNALFAQSELIYNESVSAISPNYTNCFMNYTLSVDWQGDDSAWVFKERLILSSAGFSEEPLNGNRAIWCNHDIGSYLTTSEPIPQSEVPQKYEIERRLIERLAAQIRRINKNPDTYTFEDIIDVLKAK